MEWPRHQRFSPGARPDVVVFDAMGQDVHLLCEVKVRSPITAGSRSQRALGASVAFGNTEPGDRTAVLLGTEDKPPKYEGALDRGHTVVLLHHDVFGGMTNEAFELLQRADKLAKGCLDDPDSAPWTARAFLPFHAQLISAAVQREAARQPDPLRASRRDSVGIRRGAVCGSAGHGRVSWGVMCFLFFDWTMV